MRAETGENPSRRAWSTDRPLNPTPIPKMLTMAVPTTPPKRSRRPAALAPATRPILLAVVPNGM